jgi:hypothetical protein
MTTSSSRRLALGCVVAGAAAAAVIVAAVLFFFLVGNMPEEAPLARMYQTETTLRQAVAALEHYRARHGVYPPPGWGGLRAAWRSADGLTRPEPTDAWQQPLVYIPHEAYDTPVFPVLECDGAPCAPGTFQLYSVGADGDAGLHDPERRADNITSWDAVPTWREHYQALHEAFMSHPQGGER